MIRYPIFLLLFSNFLVAFQLFTAKFQIKFKLYNLLSYFTRTRTRVLLIPENPFDFRVQTNTTKRSRDAKNMMIFLAVQLFHLWMGKPIFVFRAKFELTGYNFAFFVCIYHFSNMHYASCHVFALDRHRPSKNIHHAI